jgi:hypothetical protein
MLSDYIMALKEAIKSHDERQKNKVLKDLARLGVDTATALILASDKCAAYNAPPLKR